MMWGDGWGWWVFGSLMMVVFWRGLVVLVMFAIRGWGGRQDGSGDGHGQDPRRILEERFARGEISAEEFEERRRVLEGKAA